MVCERSVNVIYNIHWTVVQRIPCLVNIGQPIISNSIPIRQVKEATGPNVQYKFKCVFPIN